MRWTVDGIIRTLSEIQKKHKISGTLNAEKFCKGLDVDVNGLVYLLSYLFVEAFREVSELDEERCKLSEENERLNKLLSDMCHGNGRSIQMAKVISGMPIARKKKMSMVDLKLQMICGLSDEELMEYFEISKSTLWRWKKKLEEREKSGKSILLN